MNNVEFINLIHSLNTDLKSFITSIYTSYLKQETNIQDVLNSLHKDVKINSIVDLEFMFSKFDGNIINSDDNFIAFLNYCNFLYAIVKNTSINDSCIDKY